MFNEFIKTMNNVKNVFSIKDLENLSGIKAHTIRIWEKRYNILQPMRTETNIRLYDLPNLQKLLNITLLHDYGYKISKIATYAEEKISSLVREIITVKNADSHAISDFKMAMINFDDELFFKTYDWLVAKKTFKEVFMQVFIPFMNELGLLWQTDTITPAHEHFISYLIKQKLLVNIEQLQIQPTQNHDRVFVLSLPMNEIHELGLMYVHYEILLQGYKAIYLGESMPINNLKVLKNNFSNIVYINYMTVRPYPEVIDNYITTMKKELLGDGTQLWFIGRLVEKINKKKITEGCTIFKSMIELADAISTN